MAGRPSNLPGTSRAAQSLFNETRVEHWLASGSDDRRYVLDSGVGPICLLILPSPQRERIGLGG
jgi:hypothetical protein